MTINTFLIDMPTRIKGQTVKNEDGSYSVFLNSRMANNQIKKTYRHEIEHIENGDFEKNNVQSIEMTAHKILTEVN